LFTENIASVPEKIESVIDADVIDGLEKLYHPRHHYESGRVGKKSNYLIEIGGRELR